MGAARSTINTVLKSGTSPSALTKLTRIKSYPQLGGEPEQIESTDLEDIMQTHVPGVQATETMAFTYNYLKDEYDTVDTRLKTDKYFQLEFGENGVDGIFSWMGSGTQFISAGEVNGLREATINVSAESIIYNKAASEAFTS